MSFEIEGRLHHVFDVNQVNDNFRKREFILEKTENINGNDFTDHVKFQLTQDRCPLIDEHKKGDLIRVFFNIRGRKWEKDGNVNYFTNLEAWRITAAATQELPPQIPPEDDIIASAEVDDLPF